MSGAGGEEQRGLGTGRWVSHLLAPGLGLGALALIAGSLGNLSQALNGLLAVGALLLLALLWPRRLERLSAWRLAAALGLMAVSLWTVARGEPLGLLGAAIFFFALTLLPLEHDAPLTALLLTALFFAAYRLLVLYVPELWYAEHWLAITFSWTVGVGLMLGPTALGLPLFFLFAFYALSTFLLACYARPPREAGEGTSARRPWRRGGLVLIAWLLGLILALGAYIWLQPPLGSWLLTHWPASPTPMAASALPPTLTYLESQILLFALLWLVSILVGLGLRPRPLSLSPAPGSSKWAALGLGLLALAAVGLTLDPPLRPRRGDVLFYDDGQQDWTRPEFGRYGTHSGGSFSTWPDYLALYGYGSRSGELTAGNLAGARAVVLVDLEDSFSAEEAERLLAFVDQGGALIIWGEHTGAYRVREPINDLLARMAGVPLRLRFDSAVPVRQGWAQGLTLLPQPAVYGVQEPLDLVIAIGGSLEISPPARPLIVGRFGHSDSGDLTNRARNYTGDMRYRPGERLGDVVLAAEASYGSGRVILLGDTTPLGSVNLMTTMPFQAQLLDWATAQPTGGLGRLLRNGWLGGLLLLAAIVFLALGRSRLTLFGVALVLALSLALTSWANTARSAPLVPSGPIAYIDISHQERFDRLLWEDTSIGGLYNNLVRNGSVPLLLRDVDAEALDEAELLILIAPGNPFSPSEIETISRWVEGGGRLLVSVGWEESEASQSLLAALGLEVGHIPLGPVEVERGTGPVRFHEAWPLSASDPQAQTLVAGYGYPLAVYQPWGQGGVVLIGDSAFLLGGTLEGQDSYQEGNILFLRDILQDTLRVGGRP